MSDGRKVRYLDINAKLAESGMLNADKLHPSEKAYQVWADALKPIFQELLGSPSTEDHAPPPTGDPSAHR
jgi:lysophospholipase L1-like esterase